MNVNTNAYSGQQKIKLEPNRYLHFLIYISAGGNGESDET